MFDNLLEAEQKLLEACQTGEVLHLADERPSNKTDGNEIRGAFVRQLILSNNQEIEIAKKKFILKVDPIGIQFRGVYVSGTFDFSYCATYLPFSFIYSIFEEEIDLSDSKIRFLNLHGSSLPSINAQRIICEGAIFLRQKFEVNGIVDFASAQIGGSLDCSNGKFFNENGYVLNCNSAKIDGNVFLSNSFDAKGKVDFISSQIGGSLDCSRGKFTKEDCDVFNCSSAIIQGSVFLRNGFIAKGKVNFNSAQIGSSLICSKCKFINKNGDALNFNSAQIDGNVFFEKGFYVSGSVNFIASKIGKISISNKIRIKGNYLFALVKVDTINITKIYFNEDFLKKNGFVELVLDGLEYSHLSGENLDSSTLVQWLEKMPEFKPQPYKQLAKVLRNMGHNRDADDIMIEYHDKVHLDFKKLIGKISSLKNIIKMPIHIGVFIIRFLYKITAGYGYKPMRVFVTMALIWILCGTFFWAVSKVAVFAPSDPLIFQKKEFYECNVNTSGTPISRISHWSDYNSSNNWTANTKLDGEYSTFSPYWYSLDILLPIVDLQMDKDWGQFVPSDEVTLNHVTRWVVWIEILSGWIFSLILVAILSGLAKNEKD